MGWCARAPAFSGTFLAQHHSLPQLQLRNHTHSPHTLYPDSADQPGVIFDIGHVPGNSQDTVRDSDFSGGGLCALTTARCKQFHKRYRTRNVGASHAVTWAVTRFFTDRTVSSALVYDAARPRAYLLVYRSCIVTHTQLTSHSQFKTNLVLLSVLVEGEAGTVL